MTGRLLTVEEAANLVGCSARTIRRRVAAGALPAFRDGGLVRIPEAAFAAYVAARTSSAPAPHTSSARRTPSSPAGGPAVLLARARSLFDVPDPLSVR